MTTFSESIKASLSFDGYAIVERIVGAEQIRQLRAEAEALLGRAEDTRRVGGVRNPLAQSEQLATLVAEAGLHRFASDLLGADARPVRSILFDKPADANWAVPWHQDVTIAVRDRVEVDGFGPWSIKDGIHHVQPPAEILGAMVTLRLSIDACHAANGPLRVIPRSQARGLLRGDELSSIIESGPIVDCTTDAGGLVIMRPLILHSSRKAERPDHRRVLHIEYAACDLPAGLQFAE